MVKFHFTLIIFPSFFIDYNLTTNITDITVSQMVLIDMGTPCYNSFVADTGLVRND